MPPLTRWTPTDAMELYHMDKWGQGYFHINAKGHVAARPNPGSPVDIDLMELVEDARGRGHHLPLLIRFSDILRGRLERLHEAFFQARKLHKFEGDHLAVYPVKVNQQRQVAEEVVRFGEPHGIGLEAGSKAELVEVLALQNRPGSVIICNGYKDAEYIRLALKGQRLGKRVFLVVEKLGELPLLLRLAREEGVAPLIGIRVKLVSSGSGKWESSGGDQSKFGLTAADLVAAVEGLKREGMLDAFKLIHFHIGSQVTNIRRIKSALKEMGRYYAELSALGCRLEYVDVGGGLGVDYDGSRSTHSSSINYSEQEYANDVVGALAEVCRAEELPHPGIVTESGRAITAHHAMLVFNVFETHSLAHDQPEISPLPGEDIPESVAQMETLMANLTNSNLLESWHDALHLRDEGNKMFDLGFLSLRHRAQAHNLFWRIARSIQKELTTRKEIPEELEALDAILADKYFGNFSVFQSLPDAWAIQQQFPIAPIHRHTELPTRNGVLQDLTCDSDGKIDLFISPSGKRTTLPLHPLNGTEPYYIGVFLTGAYQEILGDLHNLFGDTNAIHVTLKDRGGWTYEQIIRGESVTDVLDYVNFKGEDLAQRMETQVNDSVAAGRMTPTEGQALLAAYRATLQSYTYLHQEERS